MSVLKKIEKATKRLEKIEDELKKIPELAKKSTEFTKEIKNIKNVANKLTKDINNIVKEFNKIKNDIVNLGEEIGCKFKSIINGIKQLPKNAKKFGNNFNKFFTDFNKAFIKRLGLIFHAITCADELAYDFIIIKYTNWIKEQWSKTSRTIKILLAILLGFFIWLLSTLSAPIALVLVLFPPNWPILFSIIGGIFSIIGMIVVYAIYKWLMGKYYKKVNKCTVKYIKKKSKEIDKITPSFKDFLKAIDISKIFDLDLDLDKCDK